MRGNCIRFTDAAGYTEEKTYDGLNHLKTQTTPGGEVTTWNYTGDRVILRAVRFLNEKGDVVTVIPRG